MNDYIPLICFNILCIIYGIVFIKFNLSKKHAKHNRIKEPEKLSKFIGINAILAGSISSIVIIIFNIIGLSERAIGLSSSLIILSFVLVLVFGSRRYYGTEKI